MYLVHAVKHMSSCGTAYGVLARVNIEDVLLEEAKKSIKKTAFRLGVPSEHQIVKVGSAKSFILYQAESLEIDLILIGSYGCHSIFNYYLVLRQTLSYIGKNAMFWQSGLKSNVFLSRAYIYPALLFLSKN